MYNHLSYNTGNERCGYSNTVKLRLIQDRLDEDVDGDDLTKHDKCLCKIMPRPKLLRELLWEDGVIFASIDDNEVHHLRCLMDEVFGKKFSGQASIGITESASRITLGGHLVTITYLVSSVNSDTRKTIINLSFGQCRVARVISQTPTMIHMAPSS